MKTIKKLTNSQLRQLIDSYHAKRNYGQAFELACREWNTRQDAQIAR